MYCIDTGCIQGCTLGQAGCTVTVRCIPAEIEKTIDTVTNVGQSCLTIFLLARAHRSESLVWLVSFLDERLNVGHY